MQSIGLRVSTIALALWVTGAAAQEPEPPKSTLDQGQIDNDPLRGIVINRTMTVMGWDFYRNFTQVWQALYPDSLDTMTITERPTAQFGSEIWISYLDQTIYHTFLSPARSRARDESRNAVEVVHNNIEIIDAQRKFVQDADLGPEEM